MISGKPLPGLASCIFLEDGDGNRFSGKLEKDEADTFGSFRQAFRFAAGEMRAQLVVVAPGYSNVRIEITPVGDSKPHRIGFSYHSPRNERIHGLTERVVDGGDGATWNHPGPVKLDRRGDTVNMYVTPTVSMYTPFHIGSIGARSYGIYVDSTWPGTYDLAATDPETVWFAFEGPSLRIFVFPGPHVSDVLDQYTSLTGRPILPPKWACLVWRWRDEHKDPGVLFDGTANPSPYNSQVWEDIWMFNRLDIPCGVYWVDRPWAKGGWGFDDFEPDPGRLPNFAAMVKWLEEEEGIKFLLWTSPRVRGEINAVAKERGYLAPGSDQIIDLTNPEAVAWFTRQWQKVVKMGVAGFKLDRSEEIVPSGDGDIYSDGRSGRELRNLYPVLYAKMNHDGMRELRGDDFVVMPRAGFAGSQKYAVFWGGDTVSNSIGLRSVIISCQRVGLMGMPFWGSDTGGYPFEPNREVFARWLELSCFNPIMEVGGKGAHAPWAMRDVPHYDEELIEIYRYYAKLHTLLANYTYEYAKQANHTGAPIVRPLFYHFPDDDRCWHQWDEFLYGRDILVAPIWEEERRERTVYLPRGRWLDYWDETRVHEGPKEITVECPLGRIPVFLRDDHRVPVRHTDRGPIRRALRPAAGDSRR